MSDDNGSWNAIVSLASQIKDCEKFGLITPSIAMSFICIDTMASLARPIDKDRVTRKDFIEWVERYLKAHPEQVYQYRGMDVYAARCAFLHTYGSKSGLHEKGDDVLEFIYHDGGMHVYNPSVDPKLVIIATRSFTNDVVNAVSDFLDMCANDCQLKDRVRSRLTEVLGLVPINQHEANKRH